MLGLIAFVSGATVMIFELAGSRIIAPFFGTSIIVWTSLIGVVLGSLSLGYYYGGRLADRQPTHGKLAAILLSAAIFVSFSILLKEPLLFYIQRTVFDIRISGLLASIFLFAPASVCLGMVSPYVVRLQLKSIDDSGRTIGNLYALSTIGSITGTFLAGFLIIPLIGSTKILFLLVVILIMLAVLSGGKDFLRGKKAILLVLVIVLTRVFVFSSEKYFESNNIIDVDTRYSRYWIREQKAAGTDKNIRVLLTDPHGIQSAVYTEENQINELVSEYARFFRITDLFVPNPKRALLIGGGAYTIVNDFALNHKEAFMDVVEIDPELENLAKEYFYFVKNENTAIHNMDGRVYLNRYKDAPYDIIYLDAFSSHLSVPFQLTTAEAVKKLYDNINENGVLITNIVSAVEGGDSSFLQAQIATYRKYFSQVLVFPIRINQPEVLQNVILLALKNSEVPMSFEDSRYYENFWKHEIISEVPPLTDDYAPVDYYAMKLLIE